MMKKGFVIFLLSFYGIYAVAETYSGTCGTNLNWSLNTETGVLNITGSGAMEGYANGNAPWYAYRSSITSISLPNGLTSVGKAAFYNCNKLTSVIVPEGVQYIRFGAFSGSSIKSITLPTTLLGIEQDAFRHCASLSTIDIPDQTNLDVYVFCSCNKLTSIHLPSSMKYIPAGLLNSCTALTSVTLPIGITNIQYDAFRSCTKLQTIDIPESVTEIGNDAFHGCLSFKSFRFPKNIKKIGSNVIAGAAIDNWSGNYLGNTNHLEYVICEASDVPTTSATAFKLVDNTKVHLFVQDSCRAKYKANIAWSEYFKDDIYSYNPGFVNIIDIEATTAKLVFFLIDSATYYHIQIDNADNILLDILVDANGNTLSTYQNICQRVGIKKMVEQMDTVAKTSEMLTIDITNLQPSTTYQYGLQAYAGSVPKDGIVPLDANPIFSKFGEFTTRAATALSEINTNKKNRQISNGMPYNLLGQPVGETYKGIIIKNGKKYLQ